MRRLAVVLAALPGLALVVWFGGLGPAEVVPGGLLWGRSAPVPEDWSFTDAIPQVQLEVRRGGVLPWSVTTWVMADGADLFIGASHCNRIWTRTVEQHPDVRVRIDGRLYALRTRRVDDPAVAARVAPIVLQKYLGIASASARYDETSPGCLFRLEARP